MRENGTTPWKQALVDAGLSIEDDHVPTEHDLSGNLHVMGDAGKLVWMQYIEGGGLVRVNFILHSDRAFRVRVEKELIDAGFQRAQIANKEIERARRPGG